MKYFSFLAIKAYGSSGKAYGCFLWNILVDGQITVVPICHSCLAGAMPMLRVLASESLSAEGILKPLV